MKPSEQIAMAIDGFVLCGGDIDIESLVILIEPHTAKLEAEIEALREIIMDLPEWNGKSLDYYLSPVRKESK